MVQTMADYCRARAAKNKAGHAKKNNATRAGARKGREREWGGGLRLYDIESPIP